MRRSVAALVLLGATLLGTSTAAAAVHQRFFATPRPLKASCELDVGLPGTPSGVICVVLSGNPSRIESATLSASGVVHACRGLACAANAPEHEPTLAVGRSTALGPFRCTSLAAAVRCVVAATGKGFMLRATGVQRL